MDLQASTSQQKIDPEEVRLLAKTDEYQVEREKLRLSEKYEMLLRSVKLPYYGILLDPDSGGRARAKRHLVERRVKGLPKLYKIMPRDEFCDLFPKRCPGCIGMTLICAAELLDDSSLMVEVIAEMLNDPEAEIVTEEEMDRFRRLSMEKWTRRGDDNSYPFMGNCLDFDRSFAGGVKKFGHLIKSPHFSEKMSTHRTECIEFVKRFFAGPAYNDYAKCTDVDDFCASL